MIILRKAIASSVNILIVLVITSPIYWLTDLDWWRVSCIALFFLYALLLPHRCLGQMVARTYQNKPTNLAFAVLYTVGFTTVIFWIWFPLDLALANGLFVQMPCLLLSGNTLHGLIAGRQTMTESEYLFECLALKGECPDCHRNTIINVSETHMWCKYCRAGFLVSGFHIKRTA